MKKLLVLSLLLATPALAQQPAQHPPTMDEMIANYYAETGQLRTALGSAQAQIIVLRKQLEDAKAEAAKPKEEQK